jgi:2-polyprenyl-3-methyl-5-hydroxy-6-metoxy-1,4-benzoquinol methylase
MNEPDSFIQKHNEQQRKYFEATIKQTMLPKDTLYLRRHIDELLKFVNITPYDIVLEVGCGMGRYTLQIAERGIRIEGMDLTKFLLDKLEDFNNGRYDIPLHCADIIEHPAELNNRYDVVIGFFTLHHLHDMTACFKAMARMLKPGGTIVFLEPNAFSPLYYIQILITPGMTWKGDGGIINMRKKVIFDSMRKAGLRDIKISRFGFFPPFITNRSWGSKLERTLERIPIWQPFLPFQLVKGQK